MKNYLVGGAVRDKLLGLPVRERDWVVVGATEEELLARKFTRVGKEFPVFLHPDSKEEYALARRETKNAPGHKGFAVDASSTVKLEEDLRRRDLTINAIAEDSDGRLIDPHNGRKDIKDRVLRHVSSAFSEDPLRVLRVARFAARFAHLGFTVAQDTRELMRSMVVEGELSHLVAERVWREIELALQEQSPAVFFRELRDCGALTVVLPEVDRLFGVPQPERYHPEIDTGVHILMCLEQVSRLSRDPVVAYAVLVHDVGKGITPKNNWPHHYRHELLGLSLLTQIARRLRVPNDYADIARLVCEHHTKLHRIGELRASTLLELLEALDAFRRPQRMRQFLLACEADARGRTGFEDRDYPQGMLLLSAYEAAASVNVSELLKTRRETSHEIGEFVYQHRLEAIRQSLANRTGNTN
jgi:tRNA nucleotidyltransferase (CCA-adding enzyme)